MQPINQRFHKKTTGLLSCKASPYALQSNHLFFKKTLKIDCASLILKQLLQLPGLIHFGDDIRTADELAVDI